MIKTILSDVQDRLSSLEFLRYIGEDWGQLDMYSEMPPVKFPCALIDFDVASYESIGKAMQTCEAELSIRFANLPTNNTSSKAPNKNQPFEIFDKIEALNKILHHVDGEGYSRLVRKSMTRVRRDDNIKEFVINYSVSFTDASTEAIYTKITTTAEAN